MSSYRLTVEVQTAQQVEKILYRVQRRVYGYCDVWVTKLKTTNEKEAKLKLADFRIKHEYVSTFTILDY